MEGAREIFGLLRLLRVLRHVSGTGGGCLKDSGLAGLGSVCQCSVTLVYFYFLGFYFSFFHIEKIEVLCVMLLI